MNKSAFSIYDASAGSGKTYTLAKEYLKILLRSTTNDAYKKILAITFTNKAVEEMKSRIVSSLHEFSKDEPSEKAIDFMMDIAKDIKLSRATIKDKSKSIIRNIIHNYAAFDISTIDKFTHKVIRAFAFDLGLPMTFEVTLEDKAILQEAIDRIIAKAGNDKVLTKVLVDFSLSKTDDDKSWDITKELLDVGGLLSKESNRNELMSLNSLGIEDFLEIKKALEAAIAKLQEQIRNKANSFFSFVEDGGYDLKSFSRGSFPNHLQKMLLGDFNIEHKFTTTDSIKINKTAKDKEALESSAPFFLSLVTSIYELHGQMALYEDFMKNIVPLSLLNSISNEIAVIQEEQNSISISEFNAIIYNEIQNQPAPFIYERLGERYRHFFIDEFQDTSEMQWHNLIPLIDNALSGEDEFGVSGSLMLVGDPKQSIYRWRGGKAEQFIDLSKLGPDHNPFSNPDKEVIRLDTNYRSYAEVIEFNNDFFKMLSHKFTEPDYHDLYLNKSSQLTNAKKGGFVQITFLPDDLNSMEEEGDGEDVSKTAAYLKATLATIQQIKGKGFNYGDIVLLTRRRKEGVSLANYLTENEVPILSSETLLIDNATEVKLIMSVLRFLKNPQDKESKAQFLYYVAKTHQDQYPIHDFIELTLRETQETHLEFLLKAVGVDISFKDCRKKSLYEAVEVIVQAFIPSRATISYVQYFLDLVLERDIRNQAGIADFIEYWEKNAERFSIPSPEGNDAVRILTIHKSKGLEFPVVIYPFAEQDFAKPSMDKVWLDIELEGKEQLERALVNSSKRIKDYNEESAAVFDSISQQELLDAVNVLYVALTRAEEQLYIITAKNQNKSGFKNNLSTFFVEYLEGIGVFSDSIYDYPIGGSKKMSVIRKINSNADTIKSIDKRLKSSSIKIAQREALMWGNDRAKAIAFGTVVHEVLSFVKYQSDVPLALKKAVEQGIISQGQVAEVEQILQSIVTHPELDVYFKENTAVFNEESIIKRGTNTIKPDRVTIYNKNAYLLDYKTGIPENKHKLQLLTYENALVEMGLTVVKKTLLYIGDTLEVVNL